VGGKGGGGSVTQVSYCYSASFAVGLSGRRIVGIGRIWADGKLLRDAAGAMAVGGDLRIYRGDEAQLPDPLIEAMEGVGRASAHRGLAYAVFEDLQLAEYANRIPNLTFEVLGDAGVPGLGDIVADLAGRAGLEAVDAEGLDMPVAGFVLARTGSARDAIEALAGAYAFDMTEVDGRLFFRRRPQESVVTIDADHLGEEGGGLLPQRRRGQELDLPREVALRYIDADRDYQTGVQRARRMATESVLTAVIDVPMVLTADAAKQAAERRLARLWTERERFSLKLLPRYAVLTPGDTVSFFDAGRRYDLRIETLTIADGVAAEAVIERAGVFSSDAVGETGAFVAPRIAPSGETVLQLLNLPSVTAADGTAPVFYGAMAGAAAGWRGAVLYQSTDGGSVYERAAASGTACVIGIATDRLDAGPCAFWDEGGRVNIRLLREDMVLSSRDMLAVLNGANAACLGGEVLQFRDAVLEADGSYTLSGLLRGRRGTEEAIPLHAAGEAFVLLDAGTLFAVGTDFAAIGKSYLYKPVSINAALAEAQAQSFAYRARNLMPFSPVHARGVRDASGTLSIVWVRRGRVGGEWTDGADVPLGEESERYEIDVMAGDEVRRTIAATAPRADYSAAEMVADFGVAPTACDFKIYQMSAMVGRGLPLVVTL
jgi:hypothetical protein